jgi:hypothetical protein
MAVVGTRRTCRGGLTTSALEGILLQNYSGLDCGLRFELSRFVVAPPFVVAARRYQRLTRRLRKAGL